MPLILIITQPAPANAPEPPRLHSRTTPTEAARALSVLRDFDVFAALDAGIQRDLWRHHAALARTARRPRISPALLWPTDGDAA